MSKIFKSIVSVLVILSFLTPLLLPTNKAYAGEYTDQYCDNQSLADADGWWRISDHTVAQTFKPSKTRLSLVMLALGGGADVNAQVTLQIRRVTGGDSLLAFKTVTTKYEQVGWVDFTFPNIVLDTAKTYKMVVTSTSDTARWYVSTVECYAKGNAIVDGATKATQDFGFVTVGHNVAVAPVVEDTAQEEETPAPEEEEEEVVTIVQPKNIKAKYNSTSKDITVTWTKTASSIDGYRIYRSTKSNKNFNKIGNVKASTTSYVDESTFTAGTTYYYYIVAYNGDVVSPNSAVASSKVPVKTTTSTTNTSTPTDNTTVKLTIFDMLFERYLYYTITGTVLFVLIIVVVAYIANRNRNTAKKQRK